MRYGRALGDGALPPEMAVQVIVDQLARREGAGGWSQLLPARMDAALVAAVVKGKLGALALSMVSHRLAVLAKWHRLKSCDNPCETPAIVRREKLLRGPAAQALNAWLVATMASSGPVFRR